jgi:acetyl esterase/lipase
VLSDRTGNIRELHVLRWIRRFGLVVISPEYRRAPEAPAPAGVEDCYAGLVWVAANARSLNIDPDRIVLAGISGGGGLAAGTALMARDRGGPAPAAQLLICPMLDDRNATVSARQYAATEGPFAGWPAENNAWAWNAVLGEGHADRDDISHYAAPGRAADLSGLPPTYLDAGSAEVFRDEVVQYASRLWACGTQADLHIWAGGYHGFDLFAPHAPVSVAARAAREDWLGRVLLFGDRRSA